MSFIYTFIPYNNNTSFPYQSASYNANYTDVSYNGIYTDNSSKLDISTRNSYLLYTEYVYNGGYYPSYTFTNIIITSSGDTSLATTLNFNEFNITLYPFINGSNIVINGGATFNATNNIEYYNDVYYVEQYYGITNLTGYKVTVLDQSFPASDTNCTLYFRLDPPPTATACNQ